MMNGFRIAGDFCHVLAIFILLVKILKSKSCAGISARSQILFAAVYTSRYFDLAYYYISVYNTSMKILFLVCSYVTLFLMFIVFKKTYESKKDTFLTELLLIPSFMLAIWVNHGFHPLEIFWTFSIYLEAVAILPQFYMIQKKKQVEKAVLYYLIAMGLYRTLYIFNWIYRYVTESYFDPIADGAGLVYTSLYVLAVAELLFNRVKVTENGQQTYFRRNIFFISNNEPLSTENLITDSIQTEKSESIERPQIEKV